MAYSKFTLALIEEKLGLTIFEGCDLFSVKPLCLRRSFARTTTSKRSLSRSEKETIPPLLKISLESLMPETEKTIAEFDALLDAASDRMEAETAELRERNRRLESLLAEKTAVVKNLEDAWRVAQRRRRRIDAKITQILNNT
jgi:hypothetical protein